MKKRIKWIWMLIPLAVFLLYNSLALHLDANSGGTITYSYGDIEFTDTLSEEEVKAVVRVLGGKIPYFDNPSCGFDEKISITIDGMTFSLACDTCGVVKNCTTGKYIYISDAERDVLENIFTSRGGKFPCI